MPEIPASYVLDICQQDVRQWTVSDSKQSNQRPLRLPAIAERMLKQSASKPTSLVRRVPERISILWCATAAYALMPVAIESLRHSIQSTAALACQWFESKSTPKTRQSYFARGQLGDAGTGAVYVYYSEQGVALYVGRTCRGVSTTT